MPLRLELPDGTRVPLTLHALERWQEYVCPLAQMSEAIGLLARFIEENGRVTTERPEWVGSDQAAVWWVVAGDFCLPVAEPKDESPYNGSPYFIPTFYARGNLQPGERARRSDQRRVRRSRHRLRARATQADRRQGFRAQRRAARAPDVDQWS